MSPKQILKMASAAAVAVWALAAALPAPAMAQSYPSKPISLIVPFPPGGVTDLVARALGEQLSKNIGQPVIIENRPGAGTTLGANVVAKAAPDGYTLLLGVIHHTIASSVYKTLPYDFEDDFAPISTVATVGSALTVNPTATPAKSLDELVALAKNASNSLTYGSNGNGTLQHLIGTQFQIATDTKLVHVPYKGSAPLTLALLGGEVNMSFDSVPPVLEHIKQGKLRPLAVLGKARNPLLPDVPTFTELGYEGFEYDTWNGILAPAGTPQAIQDRLSEEVLKVVRSPAFVKRMTDAGLVTLGSTQDEFKKKISDETARLSALAKRGNVIIE